MKKKILLAIIALMMAVPCFTALTSKVDAKEIFHFEGEEIEEEFWVKQGVTGAENYRFTIRENESTGKATIKSVVYDDEDPDWPFLIITFALEKAGDIVYDSEYYDGSKCEWVQYCESTVYEPNYLSISPVVKVDQERTISFKGTLSDEEVDGNCKDVIAMVWDDNEGWVKDTKYVEVVKVEQNGENIDVTIKGLAETTEDVEINLSGVVYDEDDWYNNPYFAVKVEANYLDLEEDEKYEESKEVSQKYTFKETDIEYTEVTKVKIEWSVPTLDATYTTHKTWNPDDMCWDEVKEEIQAEDVSATFKFTNYSSIKINGSVKFEVEDGLEDTLESCEVSAKKVTVDTMVNSDETRTIDSTKKTTVPNETITVTLSFDKAELAEIDKADVETNYGVYTITIKGIE